MLVPQTATDVFVSHAAADEGLAAKVEQAFAEAGLSVFRASGAITAGSSASNAMIQALTESAAVVAVVTPLSARSPNFAFEVGAAMSWRKPVYLLLDGVKQTDLFAAAHRFHIAPIRDLALVVKQISHSRRTLSSRDLVLLKRAYAQTRVTVDRLLAEPISLDSLARRFEELGGEPVSPERLLTELLRLRKRGDLPRLGRASRNPVLAKRAS